MIIMDKLTELANKYGTDKGTTAHCGHSYTIEYNRIFEPMLEQKVKMLEIGVADPRFPGASVKVWTEYFPNLEYIGFDIEPSAKAFENDKAKIFIGDQNNPVDLLACIKEHGGNFDIILDDGSHHGEHILTSFLTLFPFLKKGGYYIIEDLHSVYTNVDYMLPALDDIIKHANFNVEYKQRSHNGKLLILKKANS